MVSNWLTHDICKLDNKLKTVIRNFFMLQSFEKLFDAWNYKTVTSLVHQLLYMLEISLLFL